MHPYMMDKVTQEQHADILRWVEKRRRLDSVPPERGASKQRPLRVWLGRKLITFGEQLACNGQPSTSSHISG